MHESGEGRRKEMVGSEWGTASSSPRPPAFKCAPYTDNSRPLPRHIRPVRWALRLFGSCGAHNHRCLQRALPSDDGAPASPRTPSPDGCTLRKTPCAPRRVSGGNEDGRPASSVRRPRCASKMSPSCRRPRPLLQAHARRGLAGQHPLRTSRLLSTSARYIRGPYSPCSIRSDARMSKRLSMPPERQDGV